MSFAPYVIPANPGICICRTISLILLAFAGQYCMAVFLGEDLDTLRLIVSQIFTMS